jgi:hypothetical protein
LLVLHNTVHVGVGHVVWCTELLQPPGNESPDRAHETRVGPATSELDTRPIPPAAGAAVQHPRYASISKRPARPTSLLLRFSSQLLVPLVSVTTAQSYPPNHLFSFPFLPPRRGWSQEPGEPQIRSPPLRLLPWTSKSFQSKYCIPLGSGRASDHRTNPLFPLTPPDLRSTGTARTTPAGSSGSSRRRCRRTRRACT